MARTKAQPMSKAQDLAAQINRALGEEVVKMGNDPVFSTRYLSTGVFPIDVIFGGGLPRNRITEVYGGWSTLKSYIALKAIGTTQAAGGVCALVDTEHSYDEPWGVECGINTKDLILPPITSAEEACDVSEVLIKNGVDLLVWDSVAATMPQDEAKKRMGKENIQPARQAAFMSAALRRINSVNTGTAIMFINQTREKVGIMFGNPETTPGGKSLPFYASYRLAMRKGSVVKEEVQSFDGREKVKVKQITHQQVRATLEKSKLSSPGREFLFTWDMKKRGIDNVGFLMGMGLEQGWIKQQGQTWEYRGKKINGKDAFKRWLETSPDVERQMMDDVLRFISPNGSPAPDKKTAGAPKKVLRLKKD